MIFEYDKAASENCDFQTKKKNKKEENCVV